MCVYIHACVYVHMCIFVKVCMFACVCMCVMYFATPLSDFSVALS